MPKKEEMKLYFQRPEFHRGGNLTVRLGTKWSGYEGPISIYDANSETKISEGEIVYTEVKKFSEITNNDLRAEHDDLCTTVDGLRNVLFEVYGEDFKEDSEVTLVTFVL